MENTFEVGYHIQGQSHASMCVMRGQYHQDVLKEFMRRMWPNLEADDTLEITIDLYGGGHMRHYTWRGSLAEASDSDAEDFYVSKLSKKWKGRGPEITNITVDGVEQ